jgi:hypothetical protein
MYNNKSNRRNSNATDPGSVHSNMVVGTHNWRTNRPPAAKNTTLKNIRNRVKANNNTSLKRVLNQKPLPVLPKVNTPKMANRNQPYLYRKAKNLYNAAKFRYQTRKHEKAGMNLLTAERYPKNNHLNPNYYVDPAINAIDANVNRNILYPPSNISGSSFVRAH